MYLCEQAFCHLHVHRVCYQSVGRYVEQRRYRAESYVNTYYVRCGWFGWSRCTAYRYSELIIGTYAYYDTYITLCGKLKQKYKYNEDYNPG